MSCEKHSGTIDGLCHSRAVHWNDFRPLWVGVDQKQEHRAEKRSSEIHMDPLPGTSVQFPRVRLRGEETGCFWCIWQPVHSCTDFSFWLILGHQT